MQALSETAPPPTEAPSTEPKGLQAWSFPLSVWAGSRLMLLLAGWVGMAVETRLIRPSGLPPGNALPSLLAPLCRWDCPWYFFIARDGYTTATLTNFFPLFPGLTRALSFITRIPIQWSLLLVSNAACLGAYGVLFRMFQRLTGEQTARWSLLLFAAFPFAFFHSSGFPETLMVLLSALALDLALKGQHFRAGLALAAGVLSRHLTMLAGLGLLVAQVQQRPSLKQFFKSPAWLALGLPWLSLGGYCLYQQLAWGDFLAFYKARDLWGAGAYWGISQQLAALGTHQEMVQIMNAYLPFGLMVLVGAVLTARHRAWWVVAAFGLPLAGLIWAIGLWGMGRYCASCWPAFLGWGALAARRPTLGMMLVMGSGVMQGIFFYLYMHQYGVM